MLGGFVKKKRSNHSVPLCRYPQVLNPPSSIPNYTHSSICLPQRKLRDGNKQKTYIYPPSAAHKNLRRGSERVCITRERTPPECNYPPYMAGLYIYIYMMPCDAMPYANKLYSKTRITTAQAHVYMLSVHAFTPSPFSSICSLPRNFSGIHTIWPLICPSSCFASAASNPRTRCPCLTSRGRNES